MTDRFDEPVGRRPVIVRPISLVVGACLVVIGTASMIDTWVDDHVDWSKALPVIVLIAGLGLAGLTITSWRRRT